MDDQIIAAVHEDGANELLSHITGGLQGVVEGSTGSIKIKIDWDVSEGSFEFVEEDDIIRLKELDLRTDVCFDVDFDLSTVLPNVSIPSTCVDVGPYTLCTPSIDIDWPSIQFSTCLPTIVSEISADFLLDVFKDESEWVIKGSVNLFTLDIDPIDIADTVAQLFEDSIKEKLQSVPLIGVFFGDATTIVLASVLDLPDDIGEFITKMISDELNLHDIFSVGIEIHRQNECLEIMESTDTDPSVRIKILKLSSEITNNELIVKVKLGDSC